MGKAARAKAVQVDCLGPGAVKRPHQFWSREKGNRVCKDCRRLQAAKPIPPMLERIERLPEGESR